MALTPEEQEYREKLSNKYLGILSSFGDEPSGDYDGPYIVSPLPKKSQTLKTSGKTLDQDIVVTEIPYREVPNSSNGFTAYIGV